MGKNTVREALLDHAQTLLMTRGYNGFSYRDLSGLVGVKTSSIHYYFPTKEDLALEAVNAYSADVMSSIYAIDSSAPADKNSVCTVPACECTEIVQRGGVAVAFQDRGAGDVGSSDACDRRLNRCTVVIEDHFCVSPLSRAREPSVARKKNWLQRDLPFLISRLNPPCAGARVQANRNTD